MKYFSTFTSNHTLLRFLWLIAGIHIHNQWLDFNLCAERFNSSNLLLTGRCRFPESSAFNYSLCKRTLTSCLQFPSDISVVPVMVGCSLTVKYWWLYKGKLVPLTMTIFHTLKNSACFRWVVTQKAFLLKPHLQ